MTPRATLAAVALTVYAVAMCAFVFYLVSRTAGA